MVVILPGLSELCAKAGPWKTLVSLLDGMDREQRSGRQITTGAILSVLLLPLLAGKLGWSSDGGAEQPRGLDVRGLVDAALRGELSEAQARQLYRLGPEAVTLALLAAGRRVAELQNPANAHRPHPCTPSDMLAIYQKPNTHKRGKKPGARQGHPGARRATPTEIGSPTSVRTARIWEPRAPAVSLTNAPRATVCITPPLSRRASSCSSSMLRGLSARARALE